MSTPGKVRVAVVFGGRSAEHAISAVSAGSVLGALDPDEYEVVPVGITREGQWVLTSTDPSTLAIRSGKLPEITAGSGSAVVLPADPTSGGLVVLDPADGARSQQLCRDPTAVAAAPDRPYATGRETPGRSAAIAAALAAKHAANVRTEHTAKRRWVAVGATDGRVEHVWVHEREERAGIAPVLFR